MEKSVERSQSMTLKKFIPVLAACIMALTFCGCFAGSTDDLYALPRQSEEYYDLQRAIENVMSADMSYSAPVAGSNQQAVQLADLDGDGQDEAVVFLKTSGEVPLKIHVFDRVGEEYLSLAVIEGDGSAFETVEYADLDGNPGAELIFGRRVGDQVLRSLSAYTWRDGHMVELLAANYSHFRTVDLNGDDRKDIFVLRDRSEGRTGVSELYVWRDGHMEREGESRLSVELNAIKRIISGYMCPGVRAIFVASTYNETSIITDIFAFRDGTFQNVSASGETGLSTQTVRNYDAYASDIDNDGNIELPSLVALPSQTAESASYFVIDWYNHYPDGARQVKMSTFHNNTAGWYLELPGHWHGKLTVSRTEEEANGVQGLTFSQWKGRDTKPEKIFTIYAFTGDNRETQAVADGRFILAKKGETVYAASMGTGSWAKQLSQEEMTAMFRFIQVNWNTGEI
jgi:hypothetical protein